MENLYSSCIQFCRPKEGGLIFVGAGVLGLYLAPPKTPKFNVAGVCSSECTRQMIPKAGVNILATMLHGHAASKYYTFQKIGTSNLSCNINHP